MELGLAPRFVHPLARSATYTAATPALRRTAHTAWAQAAAAAGQRSRALRHRIAAAVGPDEELATEVEAEVSRLVAVNARAEAISLAETAVALSVDADARRRRLLALVECVPVPPRMMEAVAELERSGASNDVRARCAVALSYWHGEDDLHAMVEALVSGLDTAALDQELRARIELARIANALDLVDLNRLAVAVDDVESAALRHLWPLAALGQGCTVLGQHRRATGHLRAAAEVASATPVEQLGFPELVYWTASLRQLGDRPEEHRAALQTFSRFVDRGDDPSHRMHYAFVAADRARVDGQWSRAVAGYAEAYDLESAVFGMPTSRTAWVWARTQAHRGDLDDARRLVEVGRRTQSFEAPGLDDVWGDHVEGLVAQLGGAPRAAVAAFSRAAHTAPVTHGAQGPRAASAVELVELLVSLGERSARRRSWRGSTRRSTASSTASGWGCSRGAGRWSAPPTRRRPSTRRSHCTTRPRTRSRPRAPGCSRASTCAGADAPATPGRCSRSRSPRSGRSERHRGRPVPARSCAPPASRSTRLPRARTSSPRRSCGSRWR